MAQTWLITGTSSGFGRELTEQLLASSHSVAATVRQRESMAELSAAHPQRLRVYELDVREPGKVREVVAQAFADCGRIDVIVSNAGYGLLGAAEELSDDQIDQQVQTNLIGSIHLVRAAIPYLREQGGGRIFQLSSMGGQIALPALSLYHATKWGIEGFLESVAQEVLAFGIEVTLIEPGGSPTNFASTSATLASPLDVYDDTPVGLLRRAAAAGQVPQPVSPAKVARTIIASARTKPAPRRLALGSDAYPAIHAALTERLRQLEAQKDVALAADF